MAAYTIKDLERLSGIKAHTLRIWEQRYGLLSPTRSDTNIRSYGDHDLKRIMNIGLLNQKGGIKISRLAEMSAEEIQAKVREISVSNPDFQVQVENLLLTMVEMDEDRFEKLFANYILRNGFEKTIEAVIFPFMARVGTLWVTNSINPSQEHFVTNLIRQKLYSAIDSLHPKFRDDEKKVILFQPEHELHEMGLLFANYLLRARNIRTVYLGCSIPFNDLKLVYSMHQPVAMLTALTSVSPEHESSEEYVKRLGESFPETRLIVTGSQAPCTASNLPSNVHYFFTIKQLEDLLSHAFV